MHRIHLFAIAAVLFAQSLTPALHAEITEPSITQITSVTILVEDQDEALKWYTEKLGFEVVTDLQYAEDARWLTVVPKGQTFPEISLERAGEARAALVGQSGSTVLATEDCHGTFELLKERGVETLGEPQKLPWGTQAMFKDLYGNLLIILEAPEQPYEAR
ncbi:MAG: VOC family protein [Acidobacteriota bacterium]